MPGKYKLLSYPLNGHTPLYGSTKPLKIKEVKQISKQDSCNTYDVSFANHIGTHIDGPRHFYDSGRPIAAYHIKNFIFEQPFIINCFKNEDELIEIDDIRAVPKNCDILFIRTGFYKYRGTKKYVKHNPGISLEAARYLRLKYRYLRAVGIDAISFSSFQNHKLGRKVHKVLLKEKNSLQKSLFLIEDMDLSEEINKLKKIYAIPLFIEEVDSMPCTVIAELK